MTFPFLGYSPWDYEYDDEPVITSPHTPPSAPASPNTCDTLSVEENDESKVSMPDAKSTEMVWSIPHLCETILFHLGKKDMFGLLRVSRFYFNTIIAHSGIYRKIPHQIYSTLLETCPKERMDICFDSVRKINLYSRGRPPQPARWGKILTDLPNVESISRGDNTLYRSTEPRKFIYESEYTDTVVLGEPHPRLRYPSFIPKEWILRPILHITISGETKIPGIEERGRVFKDVLSTRVKALEGQLKTLDIDIALPTAVIRQTLQELRTYGYEALRTFSFVQYDDEVIDYLEHIPESVRDLDVKSESFDTTYIPILKLLNPNRMIKLRHLEKLCIRLTLPDFAEICSIKLPDLTISQDELPLQFLRNTKFRLTFPNDHPMNKPDQVSTYRTFIQRLARCIFPLLNPRDLSHLGGPRPTISSWSDTAGSKASLRYDAEHSRALNTFFSNELSRLIRQNVKSGTTA
ncbi:hypothetical protein V865_004895 [Kwoniella europaea PYCC6329]|uniref:F-box domain-containing protein n=1 Tax=Kwoniella europaea PYCC6329 TaxID=1423913 RepID=A0AAX4KK62_9TREE